MSLEGRRQCKLKFILNFAGPRGQKDEEDVLPNYKVV